MENYKSNSHRSKEETKNNVEKKKVEKVVKGTVKTKKKKGTSKLTDIFISEDAGNVKSYVLMEVLVPAVKKAISDIVTDGIDMILYGETGRSKKRSGSSSYVSYRNYSDKDRRDDRHYESRKASYYNDDIILESRGEAEEVLSVMNELLDNYGIVSVADLNELVGITGYYTDNKYGWTSIRNAEVVRVRDGYLLKMPKARPID